MSRAFVGSMSLSIAVALAVGASSVAYAPPAQAIVCTNCSNIVTQIVQNSREALAYAKQLDQYRTQLMQLNNQIQGLANQARNLASLPTSIIAEYQRVYQGYMQSYQQLKGSMAKLQNLRNDFKNLYPNSAGSFDSWEKIAHMTQQWEERGASNVEDALYAGASVLDAMESTNSQFQTAAQASQSAQGILQATQAGNQTNMLVGQELMKLNMQMAIANQAALEEQARQIAGDRVTQRNIDNAYSGGKAYDKSSAPAANSVWGWW